MGNWQDIVVTMVAAAGAFIVIWRTFGSWKVSKPGSAGSPHCDGCALTEAVNHKAPGPQGPGTPGPRGPRTPIESRSTSDPLGR